MAERMLCDMAGLLPFQEASSDDAIRDLPFHFVWSRKRTFVLPSSFHLYVEDVNREDPVAGSAVMYQKASCFRHAGGYLVDELTRDGEGYTYALCAAQRREHKKVWLLVAGLTGPATCAAARWVNKMATSLDDLKSAARSGVFWNLVRAKVVVEHGRHEAYQVGEAEVVTGGYAFAA